MHPLERRGAKMNLMKIPHKFSICKVKDTAGIDLSRDFCFVGKTDEEISLVCITEDVPEFVLERQDGWRAFRIQGVLDFSLIGILSEISTLLARNQIGIFAVSTYNTDYIFVKEEHYRKAIDALVETGHRISV